MPVPFLNPTDNFEEERTDYRFFSNLCTYNAYARSNNLARLIFHHQANTTKTNGKIGNSIHSNSIKLFPPTLWAKGSIFYLSIHHRFEYTPDIRNQITFPLIRDTRTSRSRRWSAFNAFVSSNERRRETVALYSSSTTDKCIEINHRQLKLFLPFLFLFLNSNRKRRILLLLDSREHSKLRPRMRTTTVVRR